MPGKVPRETGSRFARSDFARTPRVFITPCSGATIGDEKFPGLDPTDRDERGLLIRGEHPECDEAVTDPARVGEIDGANPRPHLIFHEIIANQRWADDPPKVRRATRRLRDNGVDRHDVPHTVATAVTEHLCFVLAREERYDPDTYGRALNPLGRDT